MWVKSPQRMKARRKKRAFCISGGEMSDQILAVQALEEAVDLLQQENARLRNNNRILRVVNSALRGQLEIAHRNDEEFKAACEEESLPDSSNFAPCTEYNCDPAFPNVTTVPCLTQAPVFISSFNANPGTIVPGALPFKRQSVYDYTKERGWYEAGYSYSTDMIATDSDATGYADKAAPDSIEYKIT